jgi:glycosyltransferase involved in cell wall biosynthesis
MKFSVVTISFNQRQYLEEALRSVLTQDYPAIEYIVVDPGSTDGSRELAESYRTQLGRVIFEPDQGAADGLNKGFQHASGDIFGFLNSDDVLLPGAVKSVAQIFAQNPECDIVMGNGFVIDAQGKRIRRIRAAGFTLDRYFYGGATWLQQATFFRREAFASAGGFNVNNRSCWDGELLVDMVRKGQISRSGSGALSRACEVHHGLAAAQRNDESRCGSHVFSLPRPQMDSPGYRAHVSVSRRTHTYPSRCG